MPMSTHLSTVGGREPMRSRYTQPQADHRMRTKHLQHAAGAAAQDQRQNFDSPCQPAVSL
jgi:hypothetical protein